MNLHDPQGQRVNMDSRVPDPDDCEDLHTVLSNGEVSKATRDWLKYTTQWTHAVGEIVSYPFKKLILSRPLDIEVIPMPTYPNGEKQASLTDTLRGIPGFRATPENLGWARKLLLNQAKENLDRDRGDGEDLFAPGLEDQDEIISRQDTIWERMFTGKPHCASYLAWGMHEDNVTDANNNLKRCSKYIGTSEPCCDTCDIFLRALNPGLKHGVSNGKIYPWSVPSPLVPAQYKRDVLDELQRTLYKHMQEQPGFTSHNTPTLPQLQMPFKKRTYELPGAMPFDFF